MNDETITAIETPPPETAETAPETVPVPDAETVTPEGSTSETAESDDDMSLLSEEDVITVVSLEARPFLDTPFEDYSVTEGLLLCLLLAAFFTVVWKILKGGLSWLF